MSPENEPTAAPRSTRRTFLKWGVGVTAVGAAATMGYTFLVEPFWWQAVHLELPIANLPSELDGTSLVQISDLHIGPRVDEEWITKSVRAIRAFDPDFVVITGDIVHYLEPKDAEQASRVLEGLPHGRLATLAILGNHDYACGWGDVAAAQDVTRRLEDVGIEVLRNELRDVSGLQVVGLDDLWAKRFEPSLVIPQVDRNRASLVLSHNPDTVDEPGWADWKGWVLSGHTHGGQCKPPFLPPPLLPVRNKRYTQGAFDLGDGRNLYVNPGLGYLRQVRFNVRPEVTVFTLRTQSAS